MENEDNNYQSPVELWCDYILLSTEERRHFAQNPHEYLIEQVQMYQDEACIDRIQCPVLPFSHPVKELLWVIKNNYDETGLTKISYDQNYWNDRIFGKDQLIQASFFLEEKLLFEPRDAVYYRVIQRYQHHSSCENCCVYLYSFSLEPEKYQPTGTLNFSRTGQVKLKMYLTETGNETVKASKLRTVTIYAVNYNVFRVMSGLGGLAYTN